MSLTTNLTLTRFETSLQGTKGRLENQKGQLICHTLELPYLDNQTSISSIPVGKYKAIKHTSTSKGACYSLFNVPNRKFILIHSANWAGSKKDGYFTELEGCIAPCTDFKELENPEGKKQLMGYQSKIAMNNLNEAVFYEQLKIGDIAFVLTIVEDYL